MGKFIRISENLGISSNNTKKLCQMLNEISADQHVLSMKIHGFHWNIKDINFPELHRLFDDQYNKLLEAIDGTAERCVMLGGKALGSLKEILEYTSLKECTNKLNCLQMLKELLQDHETCVRNLRKAVNEAEKLGDMGTNDYLISLMQDHEKMAWFVRAMVE